MRKLVGQLTVGIFLIVAGCQETPLSTPPKTNARLSSPDSVSLVSLTAMASEEGVSVRWTTASEQSNAGFIIQRNGTPVASYETNATLTGRGTTSAATEYAYLDGIVEGGRTYTYSLQSVTFGGDVVTYPQTVTVEVRSPPPVRPTTFASQQNYPNPASDSTTINFSVGARRDVLLYMASENGIPVAVLVSRTLEAGAYSVRVNVSNLGSGRYYYVLQAGSFTQTKQIIIAR